MLRGTAPPQRDVCGSGFALDAEGHVVTNAHVVEGLEDRLEAVSSDGESQFLRLIGKDAISDLALLKAEQPFTRYLRLREVPARIGEICLALGSPLGIYPHSVSVGVVGGVGRSLRRRWVGRPLEDAIQTDAAMSPGHSGGPLVDVAGQVLGVNQSSDRRGPGLSFAIPAQTVTWVRAELQRAGVVRRAQLGVTVAARHRRASPTQSSPVVVTRVHRGPNETAFTVGDEILEIAGKVVRDHTDLRKALTPDRIDRRIELCLRRGHRTVRVVVTPQLLHDRSKQV